MRIAETNGLRTIYVSLLQDQQGFLYVVTLGLLALHTSRENPSEVHKARKPLISFYNEYIPYVV